MGQNTILYAALSTPTNAAFSTATTGGTLAAGTYSYRVSALDGAGGETLASTATTQATTGSTSTVTVNWNAVTGATGYKVYGRTAGAELLIATVGATTTYTDTGSVTPAGALPVSNTTGLYGKTSTDVVVAAGATVTIGLFATGAVPAGVQVSVRRDTPGDDGRAAVLNSTNEAVILQGPGTYRAVRPDVSGYGTAIGVYTET